MTRIINKCIKLQLYQLKRENAVLGSFHIVIDKSISVSCCKTAFKFNKNISKQEWNPDRCPQLNYYYSCHIQNELNNLKTYYITVGSED